MVVVWWIPAATLNHQESGGGSWGRQMWAVVADLRWVFWWDRAMIFSPMGHHLFSKNSVCLLHHGVKTWSMIFLTVNRRCEEQQLHLVETRINTKAGFTAETLNRHIYWPLLPEQLAVSFNLPNLNLKEPEELMERKPAFLYLDLLTGVSQAVYDVSTGTLRLMLMFANYNNSIGGWCSFFRCEITWELKGKHFGFLHLNQSTAVSSVSMLTRKIGGWLASCWFIAPCFVK